MTTPRTRIERASLMAWSVIAVAIAARVGWAAWVAHAHPEAVTSADTPGYLGPARALIEEGRFSLSAQNDTPMFLRTPGYPVLLGAILWVTGSEWSVSPIQAALSAFIVVVVVLAGRWTLGPAGGLAAGLLVALDPLQFALSGTILTEMLASLMLAGVVAAAVPVFVRPPDQVGIRHVVVLGALIAAATMVRPTTYYFPAIVVVMLAARFRRIPRRSMLALVLAFVLPIVVVVGAWQVRNRRELHSSQVSGTQSVTLYCWHAAEVTARANGVGMRDARRQLECPPGGWDDLAAVCPSWWACDARRPLADGPSWDEMGRRGIEILTDHPVESAEVFARGLVREIVGPGTDTVRRFLHVRSSAVLTALLLSWNALMWSLAFVGAVVGLRSRRRWFWGFVITTVGYVLVISAGANSGARFRAPLVPLLALLAALGLRHVVKRTPLPVRRRLWDDRRAVTS